MSNEILDPIAYYNSRADKFAAQVADEQINRFEYQQNMPNLVELTQHISGRVLDFGCGAGNFTALLQSPTRIVEGCDTSPRLVDIARVNYPEINFTTCDAIGNIQTTSSYSLVVAKLVFHYVENLETTLQSIRGNMDESGHLLISVPHPSKTSVHFSSETDEGRYIDEVGRFDLRLTMIHRSLGRYTEALASQGFDITKINTVYDNTRPKRLNMLSKKL